MMYVFLCDMDFSLVSESPPRRNRLECDSVDLIQYWRWMMRFSNGLMLRGDDRWRWMMEDGL